MKNKKRLIVVLICFLLVYLLKDKISLYFESTNYVDSNSKTTIVTPVLDHKIIPDKNLIYCSTFQMAWNSLYKDVIKETIEIENKPWYVDKLNELSTLPPQISDDAYIAIAGSGKEKIFEKFKTEYYSKFGSYPSFINFADLNDNELACISYLSKILKFKFNYRTFYSDIIFNNKSTKIKAFGFRGIQNYTDINNLLSQFKILYYKKNKSFVIKLVDDFKNDICIISTLPPQNTLLSTYYELNTLINNESINISNRSVEDLVIPKINFKINNSANDLIGKKINNNTFNKHHIVLANQYINFKLNESGVQIESFFCIRFHRGAPTKISVEGPFIVLLKNKGAIYPYFMAYFGNDELLEK